MQVDYSIAYKQSITSSVLHLRCMNCLEL